MANFDLNRKWNGEFLNKYEGNLKENIFIVNLINQYVQLYHLTLVGLKVSYIYN